MRRPHGGHRETDRCPDPTPFSTLVPPCHMKPISKNRKSRSLFRLDPPSCALPPKKALVPDPEFVPPRSSSTQSPAASHTALLPPSTPLQRPPHATHRPH